MADGGCVDGRMLDTGCWMAAGRGPAAGLERLRSDSGAILSDSRKKVLATEVSRGQRVTRSPRLRRAESLEDRERLGAVSGGGSGCWVGGWVDGWEDGASAPMTGLAGFSCSIHPAIQPSNHAIPRAFFRHKSRNPRRRVACYKEIAAHWRGGFAL